MTGSRDLDEGPLSYRCQERVVGLRRLPCGGADAADADGALEPFPGRCGDLVEIVAVSGADDEHVDVMGNRAGFTAIPRCPRTEK
jgi:hypothetical protein